MLNDVSLLHAAPHTGLASAQKVTHLTYCSIDENHLQMDCKYEPAADSPEATCKYMQGDRTLDATDPNEPKDAAYKNRATVRIIEGNNCQLRFNNLPEGKNNFTCNIKQTGTSSMTTEVEKTKQTHSIPPCSAAWSTSLQRCTGTLLGLSALPILLQIIERVATSEPGFVEKTKELLDTADMLVSVLLLAVLATTGEGAFTVTSDNQNVKVKENEGADLTCYPSADFGMTPRVEWKYNDLKGTQAYVIFDGKPTARYANRVTVLKNGVRFNKVTRADNGEYDCEVSGSDQFKGVKVKLTVLVPVAAPVCSIPTSVTTNGKATLGCSDNVGSPPPTYKWFKGDTLLPENPKQFPAFQNSTYSINTINGNLEFSPTTKADTGDYYCEAVNEAGPAQRCKAVRMEVQDLNTGGVVAGVIVALLLVALLLGGLWYANKKGYLPIHLFMNVFFFFSKPKPAVIYQPPASRGGEDEEDGEFRQKSSFVV
ncbi:unnamed protein product [Lota lota]